MNFEQYQDAAKRTLKRGDTISFDLNHMAMGLCGEAGELVDCIKKHTVYGKEMDLDNLAEEVGDALWYLANICNIMDWSLEDMARENIAKLQKRYPEKYTDELASARLDK